MKLGILFDTYQEANDVIHFTFIAGMWLNKATFKSFNCSTQMHMFNLGYDVNHINSFLPLIKKAKNWTFYETHSINTIFDKSELIQWVELYEICKEIFIFEESLRNKYKK